VFNPLALISLLGARRDHLAVGGAGAGRILVLSTPQSVRRAPFTLTERVDDSVAREEPRSLPRCFSPARCWPSTTTEKAPIRGSLPLSDVLHRPPWCASCGLILGGEQLYAPATLSAVLGETRFVSASA